MGTDSYGTYDPDPTSDNSFSVTWAMSDVDEFLFASGDCSLWLITTPAAVGGSINDQYYAGAPRSILKSSVQSAPYTAQWYNRDG
jgi:hypothetical protein